MAVFRFIVAVEEAWLREAVLEASQETGTRPQVLPPDELLAAMPDQDAFVVLNTGSDLERLVRTATALYITWSGIGFDLLIRTYSPDALTSENVVFPLWSIGPELTV